MMSCEIIRPASTTEKQYTVYLRIFSYSVFYIINILKSFRLSNSAFFERLASNVTSLLVYYPKHNVRLCGVSEA